MRAFFVFRARRKKRSSKKENAQNMEAVGDRHDAEHPIMLRAAIQAVATAVLLRFVLLQLELYGCVLLDMLRQRLTTTTTTPISAPGPPHRLAPPGQTATAPA